MGVIGLLPFLIPPKVHRERERAEKASMHVVFFHRYEVEGFYSLHIAFGEKLSTQLSNNVNTTTLIKIRQIQQYLI